MAFGPGSESPQGFLHVVPFSIQIELDGHLKGIVELDRYSFLEVFEQILLDGPKRFGGVHIPPDYDSWKKNSFAPAADPALRLMAHRLG
jgi:hypothetical protein